VAAHYRQTPIQSMKMVMTYLQISPATANGASDTPAMAPDARFPKAMELMKSMEEMHGQAARRLSFDSWLPRNIGNEGSSSSLFSCLPFPSCSSR
jgi:hypothetical protein